MVDFNEICLKVKNTINDKTNILLENDDLLLDNGVDSESMITIIVELETLFDIEFEPQDVNYKVLKSVSAISNYIYNLELDK